MGKRAEVGKDCVFPDESMKPIPSISSIELLGIIDILQAEQAVQVFNLKMLSSMESTTRTLTIKEAF